MSSHPTDGSNLMEPMEVVGSTLSQPNPSTPPEPLANPKDNAAQLVGSSNAKATASPFLPQSIPAVAPKTIVAATAPKLDQVVASVNQTAGLECLLASNVPSPSERRVNTVDQEETASPRRSGRERASTVIYVDGQVVKKENNYVLKGGSYHYGVAQGDDRPPQQSQRTVTKRSTAPREPRVVSAVEKQRMHLKETIAARIQAKQSSRQQFLKTNVETLTPFLEPKVIQRIEAFPNSTIKANSSSDEKANCLPPDAITADMRDYQVQGLNFMTAMYAKNLGFILGDEMGLGKTLQTISLVCHLKEEFGTTGPSLIVCPLSVLYSWCNEIEKWAPSLKYYRLHSSNAEKMQLPDMGDYDMVVTTYDMCKVSALTRLWYRQHFNLVVLDEGHKIKNMNSQISQAVRHVHAETRVILTGTPLANDLGELYALLNFLAPDIFTNVEPFAAAYDLTNNVVDRVKLDQASKVLNLFMIRRLKALVEKKMPKKIETKVICPLSNTQIWWYKSFLLKELSLLIGEGKKAPGALNNLIMQLRKCVNHPFVFPFVQDNYEDATLEEIIGESGKLAVLDMLLRSLYRKGHRVCLFSQFTATLDVLEDYCRMRGWSFCRFDGSTARAARNYVVNSFNAPNSDKFIFLMSTRSGGMGLNLQTADTVILFDSDWNPQADIQAEARVHRIGQTKTVFVYRMVTANTIEERIAERAEKKLYLDRLVIRNGESSEESTVDDPTANVGRLMSALKFGCNAIFGNKAQTQMSLPTEEDIELLTDRTRTEDYSGGNIQGGNESNANDYDVQKEFTSTTSFGGIDFKKIREQYKKNRPKDVGEIRETWRKRHRKNRIKLVEGTGSGYGSRMVPVLRTNDYDLATGERSVFQQELGGRSGNFKNVGNKRLKGGVDFEWQSICQVCGDGGSLVCCPRCPVSVHLECVRMRSGKDFLCCSQHHCIKCSKSTSDAGGWMFRCSCCPSAYCDDHLPAAGVRILERCERMENLGYTIKHGVYIHCSPICENVAIVDFSWVPPEKREKAPCPPTVDVSSFFGGEIDDSTDAPEEVILNAKRRRKDMNYACFSQPALEKAETENASETKRPAVPGKECAVRKGSSPIDLTASDEDQLLPSKNPPVALSQAPPLSYFVNLPVTNEGFKIKIAAMNGHTVFAGYCQNWDGTACLVEKQGAFRNIDDRIIGINGVNTIGKSFNQVSVTLKEAKDRGDKFVLLMMDGDRTALATNLDFLVESNLPAAASMP